ncbi:MAG: molybdopterin-dependent oxidoreductase [Methanobrevibacter sp.]|nr:molybdopterin-dependent oxidoreductase [Methanobrevibacter sp.]
MLEIKHTLCPSCSVGCGINVVSYNGEVVGTNSYKRHPINEGKNCLNGRNSIDMYKNKLKNAKISNSDVDFEKAIDEVSNILKSNEPEKISVICSGNNSIEEVNKIKEFADSNGYNIGFYADNFVNIAGDVASYDEVENASNIILIGDILYENPLLGRKIVHAKDNGANVYSFVENASVTANISNEVCGSLDDVLDKIEDSSLVIYNHVESSDDLDKINDITVKNNSKLLAVFSKCNSKGTANIITPSSKEEMVDLLNNSDVLLVFRDDIKSEIDFDYGKIKNIISFTPCSNSTSDVSQIVIPISSWLENDGSFVNAMGLTQEFKAVIDSDDLSEIEVIEKIQDKL